MDFRQNDGKQVIDYRIKVTSTQNNNTIAELINGDFFAKSGKLDMGFRQNSGNII